jgi:hypothetical protein
VLQNRCALDLLNVEKGGTCLLLDEECCFYTNKSGVVRDMAQQLRECITKRRQKLANSCPFWDNMWSWTPWVLPLAGPLFMLLLALLFGPCIINALSRFISQHIQRIKFQLLVKEHSPLPIWTLHPVLSESTGDHTGQPQMSAPAPLLLLPPHCQQELAIWDTILFPNSSWVLISERRTCWVWGIRRQNESVPHPPCRHCEPYIL